MRREKCPKGRAVDGQVELGATLAIKRNDETQLRQVARDRVVVKESLKELVRKIERKERERWRSSWTKREIVTSRTRRRRDRREVSETRKTTGTIESGLVRKLMTSFAPCRRNRNRVV